MSHNSQCPECGASLRIPDEKAASIVKCPKCGTKFRAADNDLDELPVPSRKPTKKKSSASGNLQPFLRRWLISCGAVLGVSVLIAVGGMFSEPLALTATLICTIAAVVCLLAGTIWMAVDLGKENVWLGVCTVFVPAAGAVVAFVKKGPALRGAVVLVSALAPLLLACLMLMVFYPKYTGTGQRAVQTAKWKDLMHQLDGHLKPDSPVVTVTMTVASRPGELTGIEPKCEALLAPYKSYVPGTLKIDAENRKITYLYRGSENFDSMIAFYLSSSTGAFIPQQRIHGDGQ